MSFYNQNLASFSIKDPLTAFGEFCVAEPTPIIQGNFSYSIHADLFKTVLVASGTVSQSNGQAVISSGAAINSSAQIASRKVIHYKSGQGIICRFTAIFSTGVTGNTQLIGPFDSDNGFGFGINGANFSIFSRDAGSDTFVAQSNWNLDTVDGTGESGFNIDITKGNVYSIEFQWLGYGQILYRIENPETGLFIPVHAIKYANTATTPSIRNPSVGFCVESKNTTNDTDIIINTSSYGAFIQGKRILSGLTFGTSNSVTGISSGVETVLFTLRSLDTFNSITNRVPVNMVLFSVAQDTTKPGTFRLYLNGTIGSPTYADIDTDSSTMEKDTAGTLTGGRIIFETVLGRTESKDINLMPLDVQLNKGDTITVTATPGVNSTDAFAALTWIEDV